MALAIATLAAVNAQAAEDPVLAEVRTLCMDTGADPAKASAAAEASAWRRRQDYEVQGDPSHAVFEKNADGAHLILRLSETLEARPVGRVRVRECALLNEGPDARDPRSAVEQLLGRPAPETLKDVSFWAFADRDGRHRVFPGLREAATVEALGEGGYRVLGAGMLDGSAVVIDLEMSLVGSPTPAMVIARAKARADRGDFDGAKALLRPAAASGDTDALVALGAMSEHGMGSAPDAAAAKGYYEQASAAGNARGRYNLALLYLEGRGTKRDPAKGLALLQQAADQDDGPALVKLAALYLVGDGVPASDDKAFALYERAADRGDAYGEYNLGLMYARGRGVEQNPKEARRLVALAAAQGLAEAKAAMANEQKR